MEFIKEIEKKLLFPFIDCITQLPRPKRLLEWSDHTKILSVFDTAAETQNEFDEDEEGFEEYFACIMETIAIVSLGVSPVWNFQVGGLFEISYHNFPDFVRDADGRLLLEKSKLLAE